MYAVGICAIDGCKDLMALYTDVLQVLVGHRAKVFDGSTPLIVTLDCLPGSRGSFGRWRGGARTYPMQCHCWVNLETFVLNDLCG